MDPVKVTVLLVDDDITYAPIVQQKLSSFMGKKFNILWKQAGRPAIEELQRNSSIDIILMESSLPDMSGLELVKSLRANGIESPVIFLTETKDYRLAIEAMKGGVEEYLIKDEVSDTILPRTILNVLEKVELKKQIVEAEKNRIFAERQTEAIREAIVAICHEFNNPLTAIKLTADAIGRQKLPLRQQELVTEIAEQIGMIETKIRKLQNLQESS
jgi:DNA-binding NtrC family response regulator